MIEETGTEIIRRAVDRIDNALEEIDRIARAMNELGMSAGGDLFVAWREIVGGVSESRRGLGMAEGMIETALFASRHNDETGECEPLKWNRLR
ncbi:hypothetical protein [Rhizobium leguminosarum]|uniref:hypothetical protein n=1 Tax=Rhizobium leguminosarum TaxID=384 RepID=UPI000B928EF5|nr:hypothetical protein [Rhizobium leguminosarum]ASS55930.1 hypothetical protein CHR56_15910 [Rhizobium leguminosarum bv. viciae]